MPRAAVSLFPMLASLLVSVPSLLLQPLSHTAAVCSSNGASAMGLRMCAPAAPPKLDFMKILDGESTDTPEPAAPAAAAAPPAPKADGVSVKIKKPEPKPAAPPPPPPPPPSPPAKLDFLKALAEEEPLRKPGSVDLLRE